MSRHWNALAEMKKEGLRKKEFCWTIDFSLPVGSYVTLFNMLMSTRVRVTSRTTLAAIISTGMMKDTQDMMTNTPEAVLLYLA